MGERRRSSPELKRGDVQAATAGIAPATERRPAEENAGTKRTQRPGRESVAQLLGFQAVVDAGAGTAASGGASDEATAGRSSSG